MIAIRAAFFVLLAIGAASAQTIPRTSDGKPDFQGVWDRHTLTQLERPVGVTGLVASPERADEIAGALMAARETSDPIGGTPFSMMPGQTLNRVGGEFRTSQIIDPADGKLPLTDEGRVLVAKYRSRLSAGPDDPEHRRPQERCIGGAGRSPLYITPELMLSRIVQTSDSVVIQTEHNGDLRIIAINGAHGPPAVASWPGDSTARWEGDTLVVETVNIKDDIMGPAPLPVRRQAKVVEWFRLTAQDELNYRFTVEDPAMFARPWMAELSMRRSTQPIYENACHEGNYALPNILRGAREAEQKAAKGQP